MIVDRYDSFVMTSLFIFIFRISQTYEFNEKNKIPSDLTQFLFNLSGRNSPNIFLNIEPINRSQGQHQLIKQQDEAYHVIDVNLADFTVKNMQNRGHEIIHQVADEMKFCNLELKV